MNNQGFAALPRKNQDFTISYQAVWFLVIGNTILTILAGVAKVNHWELAQMLFVSGMIIFWITWLIIIADITRNKIYNGNFWVIMMLIIPSITSIFYMIQRNKLIRLGQKLS